MVPRILLADDHRVVRDGLVRILKGAGFSEVTSVENGRRAVEAHATEKPDVVFLDIQMPELDGLGACREIRAVDPDVRIVIMTMHEADDVKQNALDAGANDYLLKSDAPVKIKDMISG